jgi:hypothetical protein
MDTSSKAVLGLGKRNECIRNLCVAGNVEGRKPMGSNDKRAEVEGKAAQ